MWLYALGRLNWCSLWQWTNLNCRVFYIFQFCPVLFMWKPIISLFSIYNGFIQLMLITLEFKSSILSSIRFVLVNFCFVKDCVCEMDNPESLPSMYFSFCCRCGNWKQRRGYRLKDGLYETAHRSLIKLDICEVYLSCLTK